MFEWSICIMFLVYHYTISPTILNVISNLFYGLNYFLGTKKSPRILLQDPGYITAFGNLRSIQLEVRELRRFYG